MINTWFGLTIICLFINSIIGQQLTNDYLINLDKSTNSDQSDLKRTPFDNNKVKINEKTVNKGDLSPLNGQSNANVIKKPGNGQLIDKLDDKGLTVNGTKESTHLVESKDKNDVYKSLDEILNLAGLANAEFLVPSSDPKSFMIKTRIKTSETSEKEEEDEEDEDEEKGDEEEDDDDDEEDEKKETTVKKTKKSTGKKSKKSSKKSKKKSKKKKKKKCCCC